ncbi:MAG: UDP-N-acetylmuramoyl-tripeptide--D-alanyl-D-alanine ligase [Nocardioidaceae bacterium]|nr:UDP-N-acetylmuramoyl-tripeptide--D-alanyl-D-alanine ligase [Nocardioidaceae bacterium]MCL2614989.1 UDP-N-acetylmuramoyl-tripeptide--D-alanyl-D-alanine ligase [Nocardioidaceae bacterium]
MISMTLAELAEVVGGSVHGPGDLVVSAPAYVDSRTPVAGGLFVAIVGERSDGHDHVADAHAVLGSRPTDRPTVVVADPVTALGRLARHVVDRLTAQGLTVLALTGSQGKTGTKDYLASVLSAVVGPEAVVATTANNNNELGVPLTALRATTHTRHLVLEMGARGVGHIAYLCGIAPPRISGVLNVGSAHIGEFGGREAIAQAKGEIVEALPAEGVAVLNADDALVAAMVPRTPARVLTFGSAGEVAWRDLELDELGRPSFTLSMGESDHRVVLLQTGAHQAANAAAAAAFAVAAGLEPADIARALGEARSASPWRMEVSERSDGLVVINDSYNANPESMRAALSALVAVGERSGRRTLAVLGEMRELGDEHEAGHRAVGSAAAELGVDVLVVVDDSVAPFAAGVDSTETEIVLTSGKEQAGAWLRQNAGPRDVVLVKASRGAALERIAEQLLASADVPDQPEENPT